MTRTALDNSQLNRRLFIFRTDYLAEKNLQALSFRLLSKLDFVINSSEQVGEIQFFRDTAPEKNIVGHELSTERGLFKNPYSSTETWCFDGRILSCMGRGFSLTGIESLLLKQLLFNDQRISSKAELIQGINRDPECYRGLEMCLSRLQDKFSAIANGERLFRSVRNRGYCLVQEVKVIR